MISNIELTINLNKTIKTIHWSRTKMNNVGGQRTQPVAVALMEFINNNNIFYA